MMAPLAAHRPTLLLLSLLMACVTWQPPRLAAAAGANLLDNAGLDPASGVQFSVNGGNISGTLPRSWNDNTGGCLADGWEVCSAQLRCRS